MTYFLLRICAVICFLRATMFSSDLVNIIINDPNLFPRKIMRKNLSVIFYFRNKTDNNNFCKMKFHIKDTDDIQMFMANIEQLKLKKYFESLSQNIRLYCYLVGDLKEKYIANIILLINTLTGKRLLFELNIESLRLKKPLLIVELIKSLQFVMLTIPGTHQALIDGKNLKYRYLYVTDLIKILKKNLFVISAIKVNYQIPSHDYITELENIMIENKNLIDRDEFFSLNTLLQNDFYEIYEILIKNQENKILRKTNLLFALNPPESLHKYIYKLKEQN